MEAATSPPNGNKVGIKDFYEALIAQNKEREEMERRIMEKLDDLACVKDVNKIRDDVDELKKNVYSWNGINTFLALVLGGLGIVFGPKQ